MDVFIAGDLKKQSITGDKDGQMLTIAVYINNDLLRGR
jgi:hypothetical protein